MNISSIKNYIIKLKKITRMRHLQSWLLVSALFIYARGLISTNRPNVQNIDTLRQNGCVCRINDDNYTPEILYVVELEDGTSETQNAPFSTFVSLG